MFLFCLLLAACTTVPADPFAMIQTGQELQAAGNAALQATREAVFLQAQSATLQAARTQDAIAATQRAADTQATTIAQAAETTQTAQAARVTATAQAQQVTRTAQADQVQSTSTALALAAAANEARRRETRSDIWNAVYICLMVAAALGVSIGLWRGIPTLFSWTLDWANRRRSVYETRLGPVFYDGDSPPTLLADISYNRPRLVASDFPAVRQLATGVMESKPARPGHTRLHWRALELLKRADPKSEVIPGWRDVGWSSAEWQEIIRALVAAGAAETQAGKGTFVSETYVDTGGLRYALEVGTLTLRSPTPRGDE